MQLRARLPFLVLAAVVSLATAPAAHPQAQAKPKIASVNDIPRFSYPLSSPPSELLTADDATFNTFAQKVVADADSILKDYDIEDRATLRSLYSLKLNWEVLSGRNEAALATLRTLRDLQDKPEARAFAGIFVKPLIEVRLATPAGPDSTLATLYQQKLQAAVNALEWRTVQDAVKQARMSFELLTPSLAIGQARQSADPAAAKSGTIDFGTASGLIGARRSLKIQLPLKDRVLAVLSAYIVAHSEPKPDIWPAREVTFTAADKLTPVNIAIWDSGVDTSLYPDQLFTDPNPGTHSPHGLAYDLQGNLYNSDLQPLTPEQRALYPSFVTLFQGFDDLQNSIDTPAAAETRQKLASTPPDQLAPFLKQVSFMSQYTHGTHVAGIAVRGNPAARLVVAQFDDALPDLPFPPTAAWAEKFKAAFLETGRYFQANNVRVVNMSWGDDVPEIEQWLTKTSSEKDPAARKKFAETIYQIWHDAVEDAIRSAPNTLFICAAGNEDSNASFLGDVPASLRLPNLIAVGAVDQAGEETSFTSYGDTVIVHADGFRVESFIPGGTRLKGSGTSMASPNVANLAAKLIALDPALTPAGTIALIKAGAETSPNGRLHIINPKASVALLEKQIASVAK